MSTLDVDLDITGMTCASCATRVERKLNKLPGVAATVNFATEKARVHAESPVPVEELIAAVEQAGWLAPGGWLAIETARGVQVEPGPLRLDAERDNGPARLTLLQG